MSWVEEDEFRQILSQTPISALSVSMREVICSALNVLTIRETDDNIHRDYRGLAQHVPLDEQVLADIKSSPNPTDRLLDEWEKQVSGIKILTLLDVIIKMTRFDVIDDLHSKLVDSLQYYEQTFCPTSESGLPFTFVCRDSWKANNVKIPTAKLSLPMNIVALNSYETDSLDAACEIVRQRQQKLIEQRGSDVDCNFFICSEGTVLEGTGWELKCDLDSQLCCFIITFIGKYDDQIPNPKMMDAAQKLLHYGVGKGFISRFYSIYDMNSIQEFQRGPGRKVMDVVKNWPQFEAMGDIRTIRSTPTIWIDNDA